MPWLIFFSCEGPPAAHVHALRWDGGQGRLRHQVSWHTPTTPPPAHAPRVPQSPSPTSQRGNRPEWNKSAQVPRKWGRPGSLRLQFLSPEENVGLASLHLSCAWRTKGSPGGLAHSLALQADCLQVQPQELFQEQERSGVCRSPRAWRVQGSHAEDTCLRLSLAGCSHLLSLGSPSWVGPRGSSVGGSTASGVEEWAGPWRRSWGLAGTELQMAPEGWGSHRVRQGEAWV